MKPQALLHVGHKLMPGGLVEVIPHGLVAEDIQRRAFHAVGIASAAVDKLGGVKVVGVRMGDEQPAHGGEVQPLPQRVQPRRRRGSPAAARRPPAPGSACGCSCRPAAAPRGSRHSCRKPQASPRLRRAQIVSFMAYPPCSGAAEDTSGKILRSPGTGAAVPHLCRPMHFQGAGRPAARRGHRPGRSLQGPARPPPCASS